MATPKKRRGEALLEQFHKRERLPVQAHETEEAPKETAADLVPVPQPAARRVKRQQIGPLAGLPDYLQHPTLIQPSLSVPFSTLPLSAKLQENLARHAFTNAFAVQAGLLPVLLQSHLPEDRKDLLVSAPTGSGKTMTYALPILQILQSRRITALRALIIVPTRELVLQVQETLELLNTKIGLKIQSISSARSLPLEQKLLVLDGDSLVDVLVCTPGRLVEHLQGTPGFTLQHLRFLVIDEGDRLLNQSFHGWAQKIDAALPSNRAALRSCSQERCQRLIFSATMSADPGLLAQLNLVNPILYHVREDAARFAVPSTLAEYFVHAPDNVPKPLVLLHVIKRINISKAIIFTNSNESATRLSKLLGSIISCAAFTSVQSSAARQIMLKRFKDGTIQFLIASDLISRGLDTATPVIINYASSVPARQYIHRVGRTARAGNEGLAVSIVEASEAKYWWNQIGSAGKISRGDREVQRVTLFKKRDAPIEHTIELNEVDQDDLQRKYDEALQSLQHGDQDAQSISHFPPSIRRGPP